ncbi:hypothetical protein CJF43_23360 [Pseudomonas fragi]|uniref:Uncharacterized protein n=1 Tax=Pseudomonas fragi TaxID=296 RepID=A0A266LMW6_PSEFR|nr:hypothetical protein [Pseudomonas fragi]OZY39364.1 hypothetical protein CJF43_23360 [Pseudomonas fragi]
MANPRLATVEPRAYRWAVHCCSYKWELGTFPDRAVALFADEAMAIRYGGSMWPSTFEVVDLQAAGGGEL